MTNNKARKKSKNASDSKIFIYLVLLIVSGASLLFFYRQKARVRLAPPTVVSDPKNPSTSGNIPGTPGLVSTDARMLAIVTPAALSYAAKDGFSTEDFQIKSALVTKGTNSAGVPVSTVTIKHKSARCEMVLEFVGQKSKPASSNVYCK